MNTILYILTMASVGFLFLVFAKLVSYIPYLLVDISKEEAFIGTLIAFMISLIVLLHIITEGEI